MGMGGWVGVVRAGGRAGRRTGVIRHHRFTHPPILSSTHSTSYLSLYPFSRCPHVGDFGVATLALGCPILTEFKADFLGTRLKDDSEGRVRGGTWIRDDSEGRVRGGRSREG